MDIHFESFHGVVVQNFQPMKKKLVGVPLLLLEN